MKKYSDEEKARLIEGFKNRGDQPSGEYFKQNNMSNSIIYTWMQQEKGVGSSRRTKRAKGAAASGAGVRGKGGRLKRGRKYEDSFVDKILAEADAGERSLKQIAEDNGVHPSMLYYWRQRRAGRTPGRKRDEATASLNGAEATPAVRTQDALIMLKRAEAGLQAELKAGTVRKERLWHLQFKLARAFLEGDH